MGVVSVIRTGWDEKPKAKPLEVVSTPRPVKQVEVKPDFTSLEEVPKTFLPETWEDPNRQAELLTGGMNIMPKKISTGQQIVNWEGRRDKHGNLMVYSLPSNDGGGSYEIAGINEKYDPEKARELAAMIQAGKHKEAEQLAAQYIEENTKGVDAWTKNPALNFYLRDTAFNRGNTGAAKILQMALGVKTDGKVGPITLAALKRAESDPGAFLDTLNKARADYEYQVVGKRDNLDQGLRNRWAKALEYSKGLTQG